MIEFKLGTKDFKCEIPSSLATCLEFVTLWSSDDSVELLRLCSGAIGVALDNHAIFPRYQPFKNSPLPYGRKMLERLLEEGVTATQIYQAGSTCLVSFAKQIPSEKGVEDKANFTHSHKEEDLNS